MAKTTDTNEPTTIDNKSGKALPRAKKIDLATIDDVRLEMASVYRGMKSGSIETSDGTKLVYVLSAIGKMIETHDIEKRIELLEDKNNTTFNADHVAGAKELLIKRVSNINEH